MKFFCSVFVLFLVTLAVTAETPEEIEKLTIEYANNCKKETGATDKDVKEMLDAAEPTTKVAKCLNACVMSKLGVMADNKIVPDKLIKITVDDTMKSKDGKLLKDIIKEIAEECKSVTDAEQCEASVKILTCLNAGAKKRGFDGNVF